MSPHGIYRCDVSLLRVKVKCVGVCFCATAGLQATFNFLTLWVIISFSLFICITSSALT